MVALASSSRGEDGSMAFMLRPSSSTKTYVRLDTIFHRTYIFDAAAIKINIDNNCNKNRIFGLIVVSLIRGIFTRAWLLHNNVEGTTVTCEFLRSIQTTAKAASNGTAQKSADGANMCIYTDTQLKILRHPLASHYIAQLRDIGTRPDQFRSFAKRITTLLAIEASRDLATRTITVTTPLEVTETSVLAVSLVAVPILRSGLAMLDPILEMFPDVTVGYVGLERDHNTAIAKSYYAKLPAYSSNSVVFVMDPMLATGGSADYAIRTVKDAGFINIAMLCVVSSPHGVQRVLETHPDVAIYTAALDRELDASAYIRPGLGDFGDRLYGTSG